jgi:hypothetical protein
MEKAEIYETFGRYLLAATLAHRMGIGLGYAYDRYVKDLPVVHHSWAEMAATIDECMGRVLADKLGPISQDGPTAVQ